MVGQVANRLLVQRREAVRQQCGAAVRYDLGEQHRRRHRTVKQRGAPQRGRERDGNSVRWFCGQDGAVRHGLQVVLQPHAHVGVAAFRAVMKYAHDLAEESRTIGHRLDPEGVGKGDGPAGDEDVFAGRGVRRTGRRQTEPRRCYDSCDHHHRLTAVRSSRRSS